MEKEMVMFNGKVYGATVSHYGIQNGYMDYRALAELVGPMILNNELMSVSEYTDWELFCGNDSYGIDIDGSYCDPYSDECIDVIYYDVYQTYIIAERGAEFLSEYTDEIVYYNSELDLYLWGITHFGTSWDYVLTNIRLK